MSFTLPPPNSLTFNLPMQGAPASSLLSMGFPHPSLRQISALPSIYSLLPPSHLPLPPPPHMLSPPPSRSSHNGIHTAVSNQGRSLEIPPVTSLMHQIQHLGSADSKSPSTSKAAPTQVNPCVMLEIPVDIQSASRVADKKRAGNAAASTRFRIRRKERDDNRAKYIKYLEEKVAFYHAKLEYLHDIVSKSDLSELRCNRPLSPLWAEQSAAETDSKQSCNFAT